MQSLSVKLRELANAVIAAEPDNESAKTVIRNIERWADGLYRTEKELLLTAVEARSSFTFDIIHWVASVTEILLAISSAPACDDHNRKELVKHARWLIAVLTWIPDNKDTVTFVENYQLTEVLFEAALAAHNYDSDVAKEIQDSLLSWVFKGGKYQSGWGILERGLCGLAKLALREGDEQVSQFKSSLKDKLSNDDVPCAEIRNNSAREILRRIGNLARERMYHTSTIDMEAALSDHSELRPLLQEIAKILAVKPTN